MSVITAEQSNAIVALSDKGLLTETLALAILGIDSTPATIVATIAPEGGINAEPSIAQAPAKARKAPRKAASKPAAKPSKRTAPNWAGKPMLADLGTATSGQVKWLVANAKMTAKAAKGLSMVDASNKRAKLTGKIA